MTQFRFKGFAEVKHINVRKEGAEDDKVLGLDVKLVAGVPDWFLRFFDDMLPGFLFNDAGELGSMISRARSPQNSAC